MGVLLICEVCINCPQCYICLFPLKKEKGLALPCLAWIPHCESVRIQNYFPSEKVVTMKYGTRKEGKGNITLVMILSFLLSPFCVTLENGNNHVILVFSHFV